MINFEIPAVFYLVYEEMQSVGKFKIICQDKKNYDFNKNSSVIFNHGMFYNFTYDIS